MRYLLMIYSQDSYYGSLSQEQMGELMGAYGHSRIRHLLIGSTTTAMIRSCHIPVLCFR